MFFVPETSSHQRQIVGGKLNPALFAPGLGIERINMLCWDTGGRVTEEGQPLSRLNPYYMQCLTTVKVSTLPPMLVYRALDTLVGQFQQTEELLSILHSHPVKERLWQFLVWLSQKFGRDVDQGRLIDLLLTHQEMAEALATTRVSVTRLLQVFEAQGKLQRHSKRLIITTKGDTECSRINEL